MNNSNFRLSGYPTSTILPPLVPQAAHEGRDPRTNYHRINFPYTPLKPDPWAYTFPFDSPHLERTFDTYVNNTLYNVMRGLMVLRTGKEFGLEWFMETSRTDTFKNGKPRKRPIIHKEWMHREISRTRKCAADVDYDRGPDFLRKTAAAAMREIASMVDTETRKTFWNGRARLIDATLEQDVTLEITAAWNEPRERIDFKFKWLPDNIRVNTGYRPNLLIPEILQFLPSWMLLDLDHKLDGFKWVFRGGFVDELHCPKMYWERMKYRLTPIDITQLIGVPVDGRDNTDVAYVTWNNPPIQPIQKVVITDANEEIYPQELSYESLKHVIEPRVRRAVKESYEILQESTQA